MTDNTNFKLKPRQVKVEKMTPVDINPFKIPEIPEIEERCSSGSSFGTESDTSMTPNDS